MRTPLAILSASLVVIGLWTQLGHTWKPDQGADITADAEAFIGLLTAEQKKVTLYAADSPEQVGWHFVPKDTRKGLEMNDMTEAQRAAVLKLLRGLLSQSGYDKATKIMELEKVLKEFKVTYHQGKGPIRDHLRYYATIFGSPSDAGRWGFSFEGHHLSLNYVVEGGMIVSSTPQFFATNPATVKTDNSAGVALGTRLLRIEETAAFELVNTLSESQRKQAIIAEKAPGEIRDPGSPQPPRDESVGVSWRDLSSEQRKLLRRIINEYIKAMPAKVAQDRNQTIREAGFRKIRFAWAGSMVPGVGHYYRIQGPTFLIEFVNTQPDSAGNPANHIHCVWRDMRGDFGKARS